MREARKALLTPEWEKLEDPVAQDIMLDGLRLFFHTDPALTTNPPPHAVTSPRQVKNMLPFIPEWLERGYVREVSKLESSQIPMFYSRTFTVPKKEGRRRPVLDLSELNKLLCIPKFRMETLDRIVKSIVEGLWGASLDILDAYLNVPLAPQFHKFFAFVLGERTFVFQVLPFGLSTAPWAFTRVIKPIKAHLRRQGVSVASFFDDFLILAGSQQLTRDHTQMTKELLEKLGFRINLAKSSFTPQRSLEFLGVVLNLSDLTLSLPQSKVDKILRWVGEGGEREYFSRRDLESLVGFLNFTASYLPLGRLFLVPIIVWMNFHMAVESRDLLVPIDQELRSALIPWTDLEALRSPVPMHVEIPSVDIMTDASAYGWGGVMIPFQVRGTWGPSLEEFSMNWKELRAIFLTLSYFADQLQGKTVSAVGQHNRHRVSPTARVPSLSFSVEPHQGHFRAVSGEGHHLGSSPSERGTQCPGGRVVQEHSAVDGVVPGSANVRGDMPASGLASSGPVWDEVQQSASSVCISLPRPASASLGRLQPGVGRVPINLRLPSIPGTSGGSLQAEQLSGFGVPDSSLLANSNLVSAAENALPEVLPPESRSFSSSENPRRPSGMPSGSVLKPSRLDTIASGLARQGFNEASVSLMLKQHKGSTRGQYQSAWAKFLAFLTRESISHDRVILSTVFNFLSYEFGKWNRAYSTIACYKCALFHPLLYALDLSIEGRQAESFMQGLFQIKPPPRTSRFPLWSLSDVLYFLRRGPCEPLEEAPWQLLTMKVLFLILLASGRRISEVSNISRSYVIRGDTILLKWLPDFRAKATRVDFCPEDPSITRMDSRDEDELKLCPVRAWEIYRRRSEGFVNSIDKNRLWPVSHDTLVDCFRSLVGKARRFAGRSDVTPICVHQTKKLAFSYSKKNLLLRMMFCVRKWETKP